MVRRFARQHGFERFGVLVGARQQQCETHAELPQQFLAWTVGCVFVYAALFATGSFLYGRTTPAIGLTIVAVACGLLLARLMRAMFAAGRDAETGTPP